MNTRNAIAMNYKKFPRLPGKKTNPIQTQNKPKAPLHKKPDLLQLKGGFIMGCLTRYWQTKTKGSEGLT